ncbi:MAG: PAS domain S-box protein [Flavobacteriales bacterium]|nr:PAS domain S-box protein [Flavobacteriales bacterium]
MDYSKKSKEELIKEIENLKKQEANISLVMNNVSEMFYKISFDEKGNKVIDYISPQVESIFGLSINSYKKNQSKLFEYFHPDEIDEIRKKLKSIKKNTKDWSITYRFYNKIKKRYVWIEESINTLYNSDGTQKGLFGTVRDITEKKDKEHQLLFLLENINECIYNVKFSDNGKKLTYISPQIKDLLNLTIEEFNKEGISGKLAKRIHPDDIDSVNKIIKEGLYKSKKTTINSVFRFKPKRRKDYIWVDETVHVKYFKTGKIAETTTVLRDVTQEKEQQQKLIESENRFSLLSNATNEVVIVHENGVIKEANNAVYNIFGYQAKELINKSALILAAPESKELVKKNIFENYNKPYEAIGIKKNGEKFYGEIYAKQIKWKNKFVRVTTIRDITASKIAEQRLKENRQLYKNLFVKNLAGVFITENGIIKECNDSFAKIFGYTNRKELLNKNAEILYFTKQDRLDYIKELKSKKHLNNYKIKHKNKKGEEIWISTNVSIKNNRVEGTLIGITEQVLKEKQLQQSEKNYKNLIENSPYGTLIHINGDIIYANPKAYEIFGLENTNQLGKKTNIFDYLLKEYHEEALKRRKKVLEGKEVIFKDVKVKKPLTGEILDLETKSMLFDFEGKTAIQIVFQDVSDKKQLSKERLKTQIAEESNKILQKEIEERKRIEKELLINQNYTNNIISSSLDIICATDENKKIREFNKAAELAFGYTKEEILGQSAEILYKKSEHLKKVEKELNEKGYYTGEITNVNKKGESFTSFLSASVLYNEEGKPKGAMGVSRDITDIKLAEQQLIESEEKYRDIFENATDLIQSVDGKGNIAYVNKAWLKTLGYTQNEVNNKNIFNFIHESSVEECVGFFNDIIHNKRVKSTRKIFDLKTKKGLKITVEGDISCKFDTKGKPVSTRAILRNITEENKAKKRQTVYNNISKIIAEKTNAEELYESIRKELGKVLNTNVFVISYAVDEESISFPYYYDVARGGRIYRPDRTRKKGINEYFLKENKIKILKRKELDSIIELGKYEILGPKCKVFIGVPLKTKNKVIGVLSVQSYENENEYDEDAVEILDFISGALALAVQKKYDEQMLFEQSSKLKSVIENSSHLFWTFDREKGLTTFNQNYSDAVYDLYGKRPKLKSKKYNRVDKKSLQPFWDDKYKEAFLGKKVEFITERINTKGIRIIREVFLNPIFNEENEVVSVSGIAHDITEKKIAEEQLKDSLKEKEVLLKEVHHRVKNNLQVISSILNLQSSYIDDKKTLSILKESQDRIKSMSIIHESLYQTNDFSKINFSEYIVSLSKNLVHSYSYLDKFIDLTHNIDDVSLNLDTSIPCGLIVNELVSNALKYAFEGRKEGKIKINLSIDKKGVVLVVSDDGVGFPKNINFRETNSLGLQLVTTLVEQIDGTIEMINKKGTTYTIKFKQV